MFLNDTKFLVKVEQKINDKNSVKNNHVIRNIVFRPEILFNQK